MSAFARLAAHLEWADARALASLRAASPANAKAHEIFAHILGAEHTWLSRVAGRAPAVAVWPELTLDDCARLAAENAAELRALVERPSEEALRRTVAYRNSAGDAFESAVEDMLLQLLLHGAYHRGQVAMLLRDSGAEPAPTDYIAFVRGAPAATRR